MARVRVVLIGMSPLLHDIVKQAIGSDRDMEVVGEVFADGSRDRLRALRPDVVIVSLARDQGDDVTNELLEAIPTAKIVALSFDNRHALCRMAGRRQKVLVDVSARDIAAFISDPN